MAEKGIWKGCRKNTLPISETGTEINIEIEIKRKEIIPIDEKQYAEAQKMIEFEKDPKNQISVPHKLISQHSLISNTKIILQNSKVDHRGYLYPKGKNWLDIKVGPKNLNRSLRIMDSLLKSLENRGFIVKIISSQKHSYYTYYITTVSVLKQTIEFRLREKLKIIQEKWGYSDDLHNKFVPSGPLLLEIMSYGRAEKEWIDRPAKRLEDNLNEFTVGLIKYAVKERSRELQRERREREWEEEKRKREEQERLIKEEKAKVSALYKDAENWTKVSISVNI